MKKLALIFVAIIGYTTLANAQSDILLPFKGTWEGNGMLMGKGATFTMEWEQALQNKFYTLIFQNQFSDKSYTMNAHGYYRFENDSTFSGYWLDSRGVSFPLRGNFNENVLTVFWGSKELEEGKSVYELIAPNKITVTDFVLRDGTYNEFSVASYTKIESYE